MREAPLPKQNSTFGMKGLEPPTLRRNRIFTDIQRRRFRCKVDLRQVPRLAVSCRGRKPAHQGGAPKFLLTRHDPPVVDLQNIQCSISQRHGRHTEKQQQSRYPGVRRSADGGAHGCASTGPSISARLDNLLLVQAWLTETAPPATYRIGVQIVPNGASESRRAEAVIAAGATAGPILDPSWIQPISKRQNIWDPS